MRGTHATSIASGMILRRFAAIRLPGYAHHTCIRAMEPEMSERPMTPFGVNHIVLNVRDIEESHKFWTEVVGMAEVGRLTPNKERPNPPKMRFYSGDHNGKHNHHDVAIVENKNLPAP